MAQIFSFLVISLLLLSQSLPSSANVGVVLNHHGGQLAVADNDLGSFHTRKLGIHIKRRARFAPRSARPKSSSNRTQLSSFHLIGSFLGYSLFLGFFML
ncbi:hypothetical protein P3X46_031741 [Hevea brasiliensis]|uniref:Legume lectin domain-containing protein n=1 Tax=Hevea brasiliensis TaxID=3981 RepID=A0ABQ9KM86_HEVBR|nr:hypothetical protein P3X46_031741 [Hevea brasiliensis]